MLQVGDIVTARFNYLLTGFVTNVDTKGLPTVSVRWFHKDSDVVYRIDSIKKVS